MGDYHLLLVHFPIALWNIAFLFIVIRTFSDSSFAIRLGNAVFPMLLFGVLTGLVAYALGLAVWPLSALTASPLGRNHLLVGSWTLAYWTVMLFLAWRLGDRIWSDGRRWVTLALGALGIGLLTATSTMGGSLAGTPSGVSSMMRALGFEIHRTFYVPNFTLWSMLAAAIIILGLGIWGRSKTA